MTDLEKAWNCQFDKVGNYKPRDQMTPEEQKAFDAEMRRLAGKLKKADFD
jgi:hypothetical protein